MRAGHRAAAEILVTAMRLPLSIKLGPQRMRDAAFSLACRLLLPLATDCKVCNMLRGMMLGIPVGVVIAWCIDCLALYFHWGWI